MILKSKSDELRLGRWAAGLCLSTIVVALTGCQWFRGPRVTFAQWPWRQQPCVLPAQLSTPQLVAHLNSNIARLHSWRSTDVRIRARGAGGLPVGLSAKIAVESPRNFRMLVKSIGGHEADLGSNHERFWFWTRQGNPPHVFTVRHDQLDQIRGRVTIPFHPEWLMAAMGVVPIDDAAITGRQPIDGERLVRLIAEETSLDGRAVKKVIAVDTCRGYVVAHELYDASNQLIAKASLDDYRTDRATGISLPHRIDLEWPRAQMSLGLQLNHIEINPAEIPDNLWQLPEYNNSTPYDLAGRIPHHHGGVPQGAAADNYRRQPTAANRESGAGFAEPWGNSSQPRPPTNRATEPAAPWAAQPSAEIGDAVRPRGQDDTTQPMLGDDF